MDGWMDGWKDGWMDGWINREAANERQGTGKSDRRIDLRRSQKKIGDWNFGKISIDFGRAFRHFGEFRPGTPMNSPIQTEDRPVDEWTGR